MNASFVSSFIVFVISGLFTFLDIQDAFTYYGLEEPRRFVVQSSSWLLEINNTLIESLLFLAILANAIYFYYFAALCELEEEFRIKLRQCSRFEYFIRILNQSMYLALWFVMQASVVVFVAYLVVLYLSFILWDVVTNAQLGGERNATSETDVRETLMRHDVIGLGLSLLLGANLLLMDSGDIEFVFFLGAIWISLWINAIWAIVSGVNKNKFDPFDKKYWQ